MIQGRLIRDEEIKALGERHMKYFKDSGCRLVVPINSKSDFYVHPVTGCLGIALRQGRLGFRHKKEFISRNFSGELDILLPSNPYCGEFAEVGIVGPGIGGWTYHLFSSANDLSKSPIYAVKRCGHIQVPQKVMRDLGLVVEE